MSNELKLSRRTVFGLAVAPVLPTSATAKDDERLAQLSSQLDATVVALEAEGDHDAAVRLLDRMDAITAEMVDIPASSVAGLRAKARATGWAIEHEFGLIEPKKETSANNRLAASIVRDLLCI